MREPQAKQLGGATVVIPLDGQMDVPTFSAMTATA